MQIVIDLDERRFKDILRISTVQLKGRTPTLEQVIAKGIPLPKGHGRLIDADDLDITTITTDDYSGNDILDIVLKEDVDDAPTIIEADIESEDRNENKN